MKLYKHYFDKSDPPYRESFQRKKKYHTVWHRGAYRVFLRHKVIKIKFLGIFTIYELTDANRAEIEGIISEMKSKQEKVNPSTDGDDNK